MQRSIADKTPCHHSEKVKMYYWQMNCIAIYLEVPTHGSPNSLLVDCNKEEFLKSQADFNLSREFPAAQLVVFIFPGHLVERKTKAGS